MNYGYQLWISINQQELWSFCEFPISFQGQGQAWGQSWKSQHESNIQSTRIPFVPCQLDIPYLSYDFFKIWLWKSRVRVMGEVTVQSHNVGLISYQLTSLSFHVNRPSHSWDQAFSKFDLENPGSRSMTMMLHNYMSRQFHRTSNTINPFSRFRDMGFAKSGPSAAWFDMFLAHGQTHMGQMGTQITTLLCLISIPPRIIVMRYQLYDFDKHTPSNKSTHLPLSIEVWMIFAWHNNHRNASPLSWFVGMI